MKMSKIKNNYKIISSFFAGIIFTLIIFLLLNITLSKENSLNYAVQKIDDSVVSIEIYDNSKLVSTGTGFAYKKDSNYTYIITNEHVISGDTVKIYNSDGFGKEAKVLGKDAYLDVAILRVNRSFIKEIVTLGNSNSSKVGDTVLTIGSPISKRYAGSVTSGIISGKKRIVPVNSTGDNSEWVINAIQFDAHINPGNSGGPLFDQNGTVIGLCTMKLIQNGIEGMNFATPIETIKPILNDLEKNKEIKRPELGIKMTDVSNTIELDNNKITIPENITDGVVILGVKKSSSADNILKKGDILLKINDDEVSDISFVKYYLYQYKIGRRVKLTINRKGKEKVLTIILK